MLTHSSGQPPPDEALVEHALTLLVEIHGGNADRAPQAMAELDRWRGQSVRHQAAADEAQSRWNMLCGLDTGLREHFDEPLGEADTKRRRRRRAMTLSVGGLLAASGAAMLGWRRHEASQQFESYGTGMGELRTVFLEDGAPSTRIELAAMSAIRVRLSAVRRTVDLVGGEVFFDVARDHARPFVVRTRQSVIEVIGTVFSVRERDGPTSIAVEEGRVEVKVYPESRIPWWPFSTPSTLTLAAGQAVTIRSGNAGEVDRVDPAGIAAWRQGWLVFNGQSLGDALSTINAYRQRPIVASDPRVNSLRLTGRFKANDSSLLEALSIILPVIAQNAPDGHIELRLRSSGARQER
ncbi:MAG: FecR domain-containing protein [Burkholderiaceae bacterium]